mmetsp:Transcript_20137/g.50684  ORF Transcript_20137/g.50684 Transcript_20137/m.50684 type:complete len:223 (-) Transcript_20137:141-809(-)
MASSASRRCSARFGAGLTTERSLFHPLLAPCVEKELSSEWRRIRPLDIPRGEVMPPMDDDRPRFELPAAGGEVEPTLKLPLDGITNGAGAVRLQRRLTRSSGAKGPSASSVKELLRDHDGVPVGLGSEMSLAQRRNTAAPGAGARNCSAAVSPSPALLERRRLLPRPPGRWACSTARSDRGDGAPAACRSSGTVWSPPQCSLLGLRDEMRDTVDRLGAGPAA